MKPTDEKVKPKTSIKAETKIILSQEGINEFLRRKVQPQRFELADGTEKLGILLKNYTPPHLQKLILQEFVASIELSITELVPVRKDLLDLTKLIVFSVLYMQYDINAWEAVCNSSIVKQWNRIHPKYPIDHKTQSHPSILKTFVNERSNEIGMFKNYIAQTAKQKLNPKDPGMEGNLPVLMIDKFLSNLRPLVWLLITSQKHDKSTFELLNELAQLLVHSVSRSYICEYIGLLVIELVSFLGSIPRKKTNIVLSTPENSSPSVPTKEERGISVIWKIRPKRNIPGDRIRLSIVICDQAAADWELGAKITSRANIEVTKKTLKELYDDANLNAESISLGLYYLSFLKEVCTNHGITFQAFVTTGIKGNSYINLTFYF